MGYTVRDIPYYVGFFAGAIAGFLALERFGVETQIVKALGAMVTGAGVGWVVHLLVTRSKDDGKAP